MAAAAAVVTDPDESTLFTSALRPSFRFSSFILIPLDARTIINVCNIVFFTRDQISQNIHVKPFFFHIHLPAMILKVTLVLLFIACIVSQDKSLQTINFRRNSRHYRQNKGTVGNRNVYGGEVEKGRPSATESYSDPDNSKSRNPLTTRSLWFEGPFNIYCHILDNDRNSCDG